MSNRKHRDNQEICARKVRELAQSGVNKHCFECNQPGVTYTDITVGSFVCTSCSGMLRGLNPPHRVKSISMTTFSQQEVEFLQNHGNEVGRRTWLCVFDPKTDGCSDMKDSQKFKEFLQDKYEKKKWHFSKSKNRRDVEGPWSPGVQAVPPSHGPLASQTATHNMPPNARSTRPLSQSQLPPWDRAPAISPADMRTDVFTARPSRSQSFRDPPLKDPTLCGIERQRPGSLSSALGAQSHAPSFPALPRPSASSSFKNHFTLAPFGRRHGTLHSFSHASHGWPVSHAAIGVDVFLHQSGFPLQSPDLKAERVKETHTHTLFPQRKKNKFKVMLFLGRSCSCPRQQRAADISLHVGVEALKNYIGHSCNPTAHINISNKRRRKFRCVRRDGLDLQTLMECMITSPKHAA
ncbi:arf-GAP domain and FG repeat-containing protein 2 isoform X3 [Toxotes jaculatrix]|uniref:arf-GAP domain and FG repeat-containing protein 2 isoform X3 n=1 Tax=Toxotes jaculatrix TaxID=941984 RepID=UPI001B3AF354|nr:arf-GAP domain and FG repeat-containing protein 2 isoform X3 [Toxotes jaculatrix]